MARDRRRLGPEEEALWALVQRSVNPLKRARAEPKPPPPPSPEAVPPAPADIAAITPKVEAPRAPARPAMPTLQPLDRREKKQVVRGTRAIDARLDLHGLRQDEARARLLGFLSTAQAREAKIVLIITGKGTGGGFETLYGDERGVLKRMVPLWLSLPEFRDKVLGYEDAHLTHGGAGALYIRIRRRRS
ncbi:Smr/MutS family protein [Mongoliimonas terrestris]|uniref:Smr/MutS family protein n=1 Tax=Mongoliimonas terrestris TaxID=1709001 RepID=UPI0009497737|nr:Smr/MutS family protein [Mongoliimonas terrestris]